VSTVFEAPPSRGQLDTTAVRAALRSELEARGHVVASDTLSLRRELYLVGANDLATALFEVKAGARDACETMYQGSWVAGLPPRFAVMPAAAVEDPDLELLLQMRVIPVFYEAGPDGLAFPGLDETLFAYLGD
jgi:hypothetical protein